MSPSEELIDIRPVPLAEVAALVRRFHGYQRTGKVAAYTFGVLEAGVLVAGFVWLPPPPGAALRLSAAPGGAGVLALSRMVAVPREERHLRHLSKALRRQATRLIDRGRWPVLVTWSDVSLGHTGHVYRCAGWQAGKPQRTTYRERPEGGRISRYNNGQTTWTPADTVTHTTIITPWTHRVCPVGEELVHLEAAGWRRVPSGRTWKSGKQGFTWIKKEEDTPLLPNLFRG